MSLSGWRPALVTARSRRNRDPALGPRLTTSSAAPSGRASTPETAGSCAGGSASDRKSARKTDVVSGARSGGTPGPSFMVTSGSPTADGSGHGSGRCGQTYRAGADGHRARSFPDELAVRVRVEQPVGGVARPDVEHPAVLVR